MNPRTETSAGTPATLTIDLGAIQENWRRLRDLSAPAECAAVVKADAYGTGLERTAPALASAGCRTFFVAHPSEAARLRAVLPDAVVYVLNGLLPGMAPFFLAHDIRPVLGSPEEIADWAAACRTAGRAAPAALHVETGMNRLGLPADVALRLAGDPLLRDFTPSLLVSHLVSAEEPGNRRNAEQVTAFAPVRAAYSGVPASLTNSSGTFLPGPPHYDLVRPGYALYGGNPTPGEPNPMRPVVRLEARIVQVKEIGPGETVGYNGRWTAPSRRRLAILSVGYADGFPRSASGTDFALAEGHAVGAAIVAGHLCLFAGRVSMDLIVLDVTDAPPDAVRRGTVATLIGDELDIDEVGRRAGTIGYEILTSLGPRYERRYLGG